MSLAAIGGSDELSDEEIDEIKSMTSQLEEEVFADIDKGDRVRSFLNTVEGRAIRHKIAELEAMAMRQGMKSDSSESELELARYQYDVLQGVKAVFAIIIAQGANSLQLSNVQKMGA